MATTTYQPGEIVPLCLDGLRGLLAETRRERDALTERETNLAAAIEHIERTRNLGSAAPIAAALTEDLADDGPVTDDCVMAVLSRAGRPMTIERIAKACRPGGDATKTYKAVRRVIAQESGGQDSLIDRGLVTTDKRVRPMLVSLTDKARAELQAGASKA